MNTILELISNKNSFKHHALLLISNYFNANSIPDNDFTLLIKEFCGVSLSANKEVSCYEMANQHPDIFIADRERKTLRLEDIKPIRDFILYPPQQALKRLFFIENCERLNANAANSLLKVLEEPSTACLFLLTSSKSSLVLPTITSRVQKIALSFPEMVNRSIKEIFLPDDLSWIKNKIEQFKIENYLPHNSLNVVNSNGNKNSKNIAEILTRCEKLAKEYQVEDIRSLLVTLLNERLKSDFNFINVAKLFLANLSEWKNYEGYHPSTALWLTRLFLLFT